ncbi:hypothetical protein LTR37_010819 [Vermiconidia calcicola]|uniref:Uncharacterized protein n=1 Tax=Vermiconidia calcicola TaxID=1690605 RepID=A0ACC3N6U4_9PEZI|nr:hypothetical protein LTR37_010819 [Vermiconidia calcicola]
MSRSNNADHFFQTSDSLATTERKAAKANNKRGNPVKLPSKILAAIEDQNSGGTAVYVAQAAGEVKRTSQVKKVFSPGIAPLTCLAICRKSQTLFAGCWDKHIYSINVGRGGSRQRLSGHTDFVKCLITTSLNGKSILVSGGADASIIVWDVQTGKQLHKLKGHTKSLQDLAIDPLSLPEGASEPQDSFTLFTASSDREIRRWHISLNSAYELPESIDSPILAHETSVYSLRFDTEGDLWTASADKTAQHLVRSRGWEADTVLQHPDFVRDVVVAEDLGVVVTACRDEEVRVWDVASGDLVCTYAGHFEEVTGLVLLGRSAVSVSIDGTVRKWGLGKQDFAQYKELLQQEHTDEDKDAPTKKGESMLSAEEEAELAELMDD